MITRRHNRPDEQRGEAPQPGGRLCALTLLVLLMFSVPAQAQVPDTARTPPPDTTVAPAPAADTTSQREPALRPPLPFLTSPWGTPLAATPPIETNAAHVTDLLATAPGAFQYDLGATGWPHGWSMQGFHPQRPHLTLDGHAFTDPLTGRPRFDLLPMEFLRPPRIGAGASGQAVGAQAETRRYDIERPLTELRFRRHSEGMQAIAVAHAQQREISFGGPPGLFQIVGGYFGRGANNTYPNSDLRRERRWLGRLQYRRSGWSVRLSDLHTRHRTGVNGGVVPVGGAFGTVYNPTIAQVRDNTARRQTLRNDLTLTGRRAFTPAHVSTLSARWTKQTFRHLTSTDTLDAVTNTFAGFVRHDVTRGRHHLTARLSGAVDRASSGNALGPNPGTRSRFDATVHDSIGWGRTRLELDAGGHLDDGRTYPSVSARIEQRWARARVFASAGLAGQPTSWVQEHGFGSLIEPLDALQTETIVRGELGGAGRWGVFDAQMRVFAHQIRDPIELFAPAPGDTLAYRALDDPLQRAGATLQIGWRRAAESGLYATAQATAVRVFNETVSSAHRRISATLPDAFGRARIGARFVAFDGDLDTDLSLGGRAWTRMRSRQFHGPSALFAVPPPGAAVQAGTPLRYGPSSTLDIRADIGLRGATLFFAFENVLGGTNLQVGTLMVPVYPLPNQLFRFGVFWPIEN